MTGLAPIWKRSPQHDERGRWCKAFDSGHVDRRGMGDLFRAAAEGCERDGRHEEAARLRARARMAEFRDGWRGVRRASGSQEQEEFDL